jgi:LysR family hydrogen peroxide-inducible transcriptional activator
LGITVLPCSAANERYRNPMIAMVPFSGRPPTRRVALASRRSFVRPQAVAAIAAAVGKIESACFRPVEASEKS